MMGDRWMDDGGGMIRTVRTSAVQDAPGDRLILNVM